MNVVNSVFYYIENSSQASKLLKLFLKMKLMLYILADISKNIFYYIFSSTQQRSDIFYFIFTFFVNLELFSKLTTIHYYLFLYVHLFYDLSLLIFLTFLNSKSIVMTLKSLLKINCIYRCFFTIFPFIFFIS